MTSEVLMMNKDAVVIAADSAVTTGRHPHPRYSKTANKIFDLSIHGNVALTVYAAAELDRVPWELALKTFRKIDAKKAKRPKLRNYVDELVSFLESNKSLFPENVLEELLESRLIKSVLYVINVVEYLYPELIDDSKTALDRQGAWSSAHAHLTAEYDGLAIQDPLGANVLDDFKTVIDGVAKNLTTELAIEKKWKYIIPDQLMELALKALLKKPTEFLDYTGLVFAGYGEDEIFPSFHHVWIYGHIGKKLLWTYYNGYEMSHTNDAWIQPFAQSSMIDRFTDGFDSVLKRIIYAESRSTLDSIFAELKSKGIVIDEALSQSIIADKHKKFMDKWVNENWSVNFHPLRKVLNSLSVSEMGHLAESLLILEELRERVTSPSESVGGPIDVAIITKTEGLIWLKRKHFFDPELNVKYLNRVKLDYT